jgi:type III restriction enzyme
MNIELFDFQEEALSHLRAKVADARAHASIDNPQVISFSAPTGAGKTIVMTALFENILFGEEGLPAQPDAVILWISDMPELNEQTRRKIESKSDRIRVQQLVSIDATFDVDRLAGGSIYFVNTQKLGNDKLLTSRGDSRQHTIWETFTNTALAIPDRCYVVIDEAHRGMGGATASHRAQTIMQRFLLGSEEDGLCRMPLVVGMSATPQRFEALLAGTAHTVHKVYTPADDVRKSGLLKDRILIHFPNNEEVRAEMSLLAEAAHRWKQMEERWAAYCEREQEPSVKPILVVQVEDGAGNAITRTDLPTTLATIESTIGRPLREREVVHTFNDSGDLPIGGYGVRRHDTSRIEEDRDIGVVLFKMSLSTGWDCPRAEVMMSFRRAEDHTYIAQLLGRMVRTPLARRIEEDAILNDVHLFLPRYDQAAVQSVIEDLQNVEDVPPTEIGTNRELVTLERRAGTEAIFEAMQRLVTYRVNAVRRQSGLRRLMGLGRALTHDGINEDAVKNVKDLIVEGMQQEIDRLRDLGMLDARARAITGMNLKTVSLEHGTNVATEDEIYAIEAAQADIDRHFQQAGRLLGNGLHIEYWKAYADAEADMGKVQAIILSEDHDAMRTLEECAEKAFDRLYEQYKRDIARLLEKRRAHYAKLRMAASTPQTLEWPLQETIGFKRGATAPQYDRHLYVEKEGYFRTELGTWEREVLEEELRNAAVVAWLRNVARQPWSLEIPYRDGGKVRPMYPDLVIVRQDTNGFLFDILEPHDPSLKDNAAKAVGLAEFADKHSHFFGRIQLIRKKRGPDGRERYYRLDINNDVIRRQLRAVTSHNHLDQIFDEFAGWADEPNL